jgi:hypothetical protein
MSLPSFTAEGLLPPGDYDLTIPELRASFLVTGEGIPSSTWDAPWRSRLVDNLETLAGQLWQVGIRDIFIDGSFVEDKDHPNDIDGYFDCALEALASGSLARDLNALDPYKVWTWQASQRRFDPGTGKGQLPMWYRYRVELYPNYGQSSGITDRHGHPLLFPAAFRVRRSTYEQKGIVRLRR